MELPLREPLFARYLYVSPENIVHVFMPIVSGMSIGLDNTCKAVYGLQEFFNKGGNSNKKASLKAELSAYKEALESDISILEQDSELTQQKQARLAQIVAYLKVLERVEKHPELNCLESGFPSYPRPLEGMIQDRTTSNLYSMVLRPSEQDGFLRTEGTNPVFGVAHKSVSRGIEGVESELQKALIEAYSTLTLSAPDLKKEITQKAVARLNKLNQSFNFNALKNMLKETIETELAVAVDFSQTSQEYIDEIMYFDKTAKPEPEEYIDALFNSCVSEVLPTAVLPPFKYLTQSEHWSIATQFLLGLTNIYAVAQDKASQDTNFGEILDNRPDLSAELAQTLVKAQQNKENIEEAYFLWLNQHAQELKLTTVFTEEDIKAIKQDFAERFMQIKDAPHFDEFFVLDAQKAGDFVMHQGSICTSFARFVHSPLLEVPTEFTQPLEKTYRQASRLGVSIPHKSTLTHGKVEINTAALDNAGLQALYERIDGYQDAKLKEKLFAQLKKERPDFKPKIDARQFLQHVAYGQQDEAETLLQKDPQLAQELLQADNIPFTDYSGHTFTCTAYEYAWWAKDSHMQRMLEKYIRQDEETRQFILKRVQAIEELKPLPPSANLLAQPEPRGLHYTTKDKQGNTIDHWETHFDLTPLKEALKHYVDEYKKRPNQSEADWEILDKIWVEEVGRAQRDVPAHIAQEYCHPERSFYDVTEKKSLLDATNPSNLKRQLKFYNCVTDQYDLWFTPGSYSVDSGLGFSFGIMRRRAPLAAVGGGWGVGADVAIDSTALAAIDEVRTGDLEQSLDNLSLPLIVQDSQSHSI